MSKTETRKKAVMSWSSGKDSTFALHTARQAGELDVVALLSTFNEDADRVAIHGTRRTIARAQAMSLGLPLIEVDLPFPCSNEQYEERIGRATLKLAAQGVEDWIFGDLFLEDVRAYRIKQLEPHDLTPHFPIWGRDTTELARDMITAGLVAHVVSLDPSRAPRELCGATYDADFLAALPDNVDPCGENGEFHTIVSAGPGFSKSLTVQRGETVERGGFMYTDFDLPEAVS